MGLFRKKIDFDQIKSVVVLEQTQLYRQGSNLGFSFGSTPSDGRVMAAGSSNVPCGAEYKFSVTYKNEEKAIIKAMSGTDLCDRLLQLAIDMEPSSAEGSHKSNPYEYEMVSLQKNQLPCGNYLIGRDIPSGTYDFTWVFGNGSIMKFLNDHDTTLGATTYFQHVGNKYEYEYRQCLNVSCNDGELLIIDGNVIVGISRSRKIQLDLEK